MPRAHCRFAHCDGLTAFTCLNGYIITGGVDGDFRIFTDVDDDNPQSEHAQGRVLSICSDAAKNRIYVSSDDSSLQTYSFSPRNDGNDNLSLESSVTSLKAPIYCLDVVGNKIIAGSADFYVILCTIDDAKYSLDLMEGHSAPVLSVSIDNQAEFAASSSCDGSLRIWRVNDLFCELHLASLFAKSNDLKPSNPLCCVRWNHSGTHLAVALSHQIRLYKRDTWDVDYELANPSNDDFSLCNFSHDDQFLVTASLNAIVALWSCRKRTKLASYQSSSFSPLCFISFHSTSYSCVFTDFSGSLGTADFSTDVELVDLDDWTEDIDSHPTNSELPPADLSDNEDEGILHTRHRNSGANLSSDDEAVSVQASQGPDAEPALGEYIGIQQPPFQPGSTPLFLTERYMVWNSVGIVRQYNHKTDSTDSIDVEYHNSSISHSFHIYNSFLYSIADLSESALLLASNSQDSEDKTPSKLYCMLINTWDRCKEWSVEMAESEEIHCVCLSCNEWLAVATSRRLIRIFTLAGLESHVFSIPGQAVCCVASKSRLLVVYHRGLAQKGDQALGFLLYEISLNGIFPLVSSSDFPISEDSLLNWAAFSDNGRVFSCDSKGVVRCIVMLDDGKHWWTEICDVSGSLEENKWVIGVDEHQQRVRYISSRSKYVPIFPKPIVLFMPFRLSLSQPSLQQTHFQEGIVRSNIFPCFSGDESSLAMQLVALFCKDKKDRRAFDVVQTLLTRADSGSILKIFGSLALKYAEKSGHHALANNITNLIDSTKDEYPGNCGVEESVTDNGGLEEIMAQRTVRLNSSINSSLPRNPAKSFSHEVGSVIFESFHSQITVDESFDGRLGDSQALGGHFNPFKADREDAPDNVDCFNDKVQRACESTLAIQAGSKRQKRVSAFDMWLNETGNTESKGRAQLLSEFSKLPSDEKKYWKDRTASDR